MPNDCTSLRHAREILHSAVRLVYAPAPCEPKTGPLAGQVVPPGWVLFGGLRTDDPEFAKKYAEQASHFALRAVSSNHGVQRKRA
jgi:hypothetical protein